MSLQRYQLAVVGAGSAGLASAALAAELGASVVLIERHCLGGDRLAYRLPAAAVIRAARNRAAREAARNRAAHGSDDDGFAAAFQRARDLRAAASAASGADSLSDLGVDVVHGEARFVAADAVEVADRRLEFRRALIATGARTSAPRLPGLDKVAYRVPETLFELTEPPRRLGVVGAGARGCEMAQAFADLGCEVHLFAAGDRLLPGRDPDAAALVAEAMRRGGLELHLRSRALELEAQGGEVRVALPDGRQELAVDELLLATGPTPNVERLGLEAAGVEYDLAGVEVDRHLRTTNRRIFAAGGAVALEGYAWGIASPGLAADADARTAVRNALLFRRLGRRRHIVPRVTYTRPEIARVGIGAAQAAAAPERVETLTLPLAGAGRDGWLGGDESARRGTDFLRLHVKRRGGEILGGTLVTDGAAELIAPLAMAVSQRLSLGAFADIPLPHPTRGEIYRRAAFAWRRRRARRRQERRFLDPIGFWLKLRSRF